MEDAATAEISRAQVWQCLKNHAGRTLTTSMYEQFLKEEISKIKEYIGLEKFESGKFQEAINLFDSLVRKDEFEEFLTLSAYKLLNN